MPGKTFDLNVTTCMHHQFGILTDLLDSVCTLFCLGDLLNELSNDGAREQFKKYLEIDILPLMVQAAKVGIWE